MTDYETCILRLIRKHPDITKNALVKLQNGPSMKVEAALRTLKAEGRITPTDTHTRHGTTTKWREAV